MILELLENLLTPCSWTLRKVGYLRAQIGIKVRHRQCRRAWRSHLEKTRQFITSAASQCTQRRKAVILGSGYLLDVPLAELSRMFREVVLVDVVHPLKVRLLAKWFGNVRLVRADLTGVADALARIAADPKQPLPRATPTLFLDDSDVDFVASVNLLSQLPYMPTVFLEKQPGRSEIEIHALARDLIEAHLGYLRRLPGVVSLITDVEKLQVDRQGKVIDRFDILYGIRLPLRGDEWIWEHVPLKHLSKDFAYHRRVVAVMNVKTQETR